MNTSEILSNYDIQDSIFKSRKTARRRLCIRDLENIIILLVYISVHIYLSFYHEAWRDESQAWVIARNESVHGILTLCASEGHPCLWFFFLKGCCIFGISFYHFSLISTLIMAGAAALLLWKSPFSLVSNIAILLSPVFFYYNPVICRVYSIVVLLCVFLCVLWTKRRESSILYGIIVAAMFQSHILLSGLAIGCLAEMVVNCKGNLKAKNIIGFIIPLVSLVCMVLELRQTEQTETFLHIDEDYMIKRLTGGNLYNYFESVTGKFKIDGIPVGVIFFWTSVLMAVMFIVCFIRNERFRILAKGVGIVSFCGIAFFWSIIFLVRSADHIQMAIVLWILIFVFVWLATKTYKSSVENETSVKAVESNKGDLSSNLFYKKIVSYSFELLFVLCSIMAIPQTIGIDAVSDIKNPFSGSREIVNLIADNAPEDSIIALHNDLLSTSIVSYLYDTRKNYILWDIDNGEEYTTHKWGRKNKRVVDNESVYTILSSDFEGKESVFFVNAQQSRAFSNQLSKQMALVGQNSIHNTWNEYYQLYEVKK